jgi:hypothetical protein
MSEMKSGYDVMLHVFEIKFRKKYGYVNMRDFVPGTDRFFPFSFLFSANLMPIQPVVVRVAGPNGGSL